jgi:hypothetical protein
MDVEIGTEALIVLFWEYLFKFSAFCLCSVLLLWISPMQREPHRFFTVLYMTEDFSDVFNLNVFNVVHPCILG